jgi:hypothetical protein
MKIRNGFVSNSSSSSFIIAFEKVPTSADEMYELLFSNQDDADKYTKATNKICAESIFDKIDSVKPITTLKQLMKEVEYLSCYNLPREMTCVDGSYYSLDNEKLLLKKHGVDEDESNELIKKAEDKFFAKYGKSSYSYNYEDNKKTTPEGLKEAQNIHNMRQKSYEERINVLKKLTEEVLKKIMDENESCTFFYISYADDEGSFNSNMEHEVMPYLNITKYSISNH